MAFIVVKGVEYNEVLISTEAIDYAIRITRATGGDYTRVYFRSGQTIEIESSVIDLERLCDGSV